MPGKRVPRHVLAKVRRALGNISQRELADYVGCSVDTIRSIEQDRLKLPKRLAWRISDAIGISYDWLLDNDLSRPPVNQAGQPYSRDDLIIAQDERMPFPIGAEPLPVLTPVPPLPADPPKDDKTKRLRRACRALRLMLEEASGQPDHGAAFFLAEVERFVRDQLREFPELRSELEQRQKRSGARKHKRADKK
jgi:transcriptional regulator with XRE-family HTH domain